MMPIVIVVQNRTNYALYNNRIKSKMEIHPIKTFLSLLLAIIILPLISACATPSQILTDAEVKRLCEKDGGIKVYETMTLPAERFEKDGSIRIPAKWLAKPEDEFYSESSKVFIRKGNPEMSRFHYKVYRRSDEKLLGEAISYARRGGDMPGPWHPSSFRCPKGTVIDLKNQIFIKE
jgi:hypothetical protein